MENIFSCEDLAKRYSVQIRTVWDWVRTGKISYLKVGRSYYFSESDIKAFEDANRSK